MKFFRRLSLAIRAFWVCLCKGGVLIDGRTLPPPRGQSADSVVIDDDLPGINPPSDRTQQAAQRLFSGLPTFETAEEAIAALSQPEMPAAKIVAEIADNYQSPPGLSDWHDTTRQGEEYAP